MTVGPSHPVPNRLKDVFQSIRKIENTRYIPEKGYQKGRERKTLSSEIITF